MTDEHIISLLQEMKDNCQRIPEPGGYSDPKRLDKAEALNYAIFVIEKQIPKKPKQDKRKGLECYCPECGDYVGWVDALASDLMEYCSSCGQKISRMVRND